jgi:ABC-type branched-subunit amino acid transport system substrate-binding protein
VRPTLLGADGWSNPLLFSRGGPSRPAFYSDHCYPPAAFVERYRRLFGQDSQGCRAVLAYDAVQAFAEALRALGPLDDADLLSRLDETRSRLRQALAEVEIEGVAGAIRFDDHGDSLRGVAVMRIEPGPGGYESRLQGWTGGALR